MRTMHLVLFLVVGLSSMFGAQVRFAIIGDYGTDDANELGVANLVKTNFQPEFIITLGDNNYLGPANTDRAIGKYYRQFIGNYSGTYGAGALSNRFFPALGNHDYDTATGFAAHTNYFSLPGNERYYDFVRGPVHVFILSSDAHEPDGATITSTQARWLSNRLATSTSPWRVLAAQDPAYSSTSPVARMRWPFKEWGASIYFAGSAHNYERIVVSNFLHIVNGAGGAGIAGFGAPVAGSQFRYNANHGAVKVIATETNIIYEFWSTANGGTLIDRFTQYTPPRLAVELTNNAVRLSWTTNGSVGFALQSAVSLANASWTNVAQPPTTSSGRYVVTLNRNSAQTFFRLRQ